MAEALYAKYDVKEELGRGAFSLVKLAVDRKTGAKVRASFCVQRPLCRGRSACERRAWQAML